MPFERKAGRCSGERKMEALLDGLFRITVSVGLYLIIGSVVVNTIKFIFGRKEENK